VDEVDVSALYHGHQAATKSVSGNVPMLCSSICSHRAVVGMIGSLPIGAHLVIITTTSNIVSSFPHFHVCNGRLISFSAGSAICLVSGVIYVPRCKNSRYLLHCPVEYIRSRNMCTTRATPRYVSHVVTIDWWGKLLQGAAASRPLHCSFNEDLTCCPYALQHDNTSDNHAYPAADQYREDSTVPRLCMQGF
jgi:hypothetical protein